MNQMREVNAWELQLDTGHPLSRSGNSDGASYLTWESASWELYRPDTALTNELEAAEPRIDSRRAIRLHRPTVAVLRWLPHLGPLLQLATAPWPCVPVRPHQAQRWRYQWTGQQSEDGGRPRHTTGERSNRLICRSCSDICVFIQELYLCNEMTPGISYAWTQQRTHYSWSQSRI